MYKIYEYKPWHRGPTHWPDTHFILHILDVVSVGSDDATAAEPFPAGDGRYAGNFTSESAEKSGDMPDRGTTLVPFSVRPGEGHPPPPLSPTVNRGAGRNPVFFIKHQKYTNMGMHRYWEHPESVIDSVRSGIRIVIIFTYISTIHKKKKKFKLIIMGKT